MMMSAELLTTHDDLPPEAREIIVQSDSLAKDVRAKVQSRSEQLRAAAEDEIRIIRRRTEDEIRTLEIEATRELTPALRTLFDGLRGLQESYAKLGKLDEALAIRANLRQLRADLLGIRPDPGSLSDLGTEYDDRSLLYEVAGRTDGTLWGQGTYTLDSHLGTAAVHLGLVKPGMRGIVRVTVMGSEFREFPAVTANNVASSEYNGSSRAYRLEALE
jgi:hypothetical protein